MNTSESNETGSLSAEQDKAVRLFTYLKELCALRTTQVRNVASYDQVFWLTDLPRHKLCRSAIWASTEPSPSTDEQYAEQWIEIRKPSLKSPPELPDELEPWAKDDEFADSSLDEPGFYEQIPLWAFEGDSEPGDNTANVSINDYPDVLDKWIDYVDTKWKPWAAEDRELQRVLRAYNQLFSVYQRQEKLGEQYEVILGAGLLQWRSPHSGEIGRHVLALQARIEFDRVRGIITAGPAIDGMRAAIECAMLETSDRPNPTDLTGTECDVIALQGDEWDVAGVERVLRGFANALPAGGTFSPSFEHAGGASEKPLVRLAPALILRQRTRRTFEDFYRQIVDQIREADELPENIRTIIETGNASSCEKTDRSEYDERLTTPMPLDDELYFPLPANDEQKRVVQRIEHQRGVLVQGPPGTGKSHTICNLVAHFLAKGKRVLVTSETPRALEVLRHKLHEHMSEIEQLCVVWLGADPDSQRALEKSVQGITQRRTSSNQTTEQRHINDLEGALDSERRLKSELYTDLRACKESDIHQHMDVFDRYSGTLQQIAVQLRQESGRFDWFIDRPETTADPNVTCDELHRMARTHREQTPELIEQLKCHLFPLEQLLRPDEFSHLVEAERKAKLACSETQAKWSYPGYAELPTLDREKRNNLRRLVDEIVAAQHILSRHYLAWAERASHEISGDQDRVWRRILTATIDHIDRIEEILRVHGTLEVKGLDGRDRHLVEEHANALRRHLESGKRLQYWLLRERSVKDARYLVQSVTINGKSCNSIETLDQLRAWIELSYRVETLADIWTGITTPPSGRVDLQCSAYRDMCEPIEQSLAIYDRIQDVRRICMDRPGVHLPAWHSLEEIVAFADVLTAVSLEEDLAGVQDRFLAVRQALADCVNPGLSHVTAEQLLSAVCERDCALYSNTYERLSSLHVSAEEYEYACDVRERFRACAPLTCESYEASCSQELWDTRFVEFQEAWTWAKADLWLDEMRDTERPRQIQQAIEQSVLQEREIVTHLAAAKAWKHCLSRLGEAERMALVAWKHAADKIRSGHGKDVEFWRDVARQRMDECRHSVPAWIMPLYQVVQTVRVQKNAFDLAIVDEASQSGPIGLFLRYIAEKVIVVGDNKQITPLYTGIELEAAHFLRKKYLYDIPFAEQLLPSRENSLFSEAQLRFGDPIQLKEHFRCMPEIIQFCNNLSYPTEPLIPLRQHGAQRLEPVRTVYVKDGYREGSSSSSSIHNLPEAEAIVAQIAECCEDPMYAGKTFGVISLMGNRQAELINSLLLGKNGIGAQEMEKRRLRCGRPYDFQGEERHVIFLSMTDAPQGGATCRMVRDPDTQRAFNVAVSRAQDQLWLFHSATLNDLRPECLRYRLLEYCLNPRVEQPEPVGDTTVAEVRRMASDKPCRARRPREVNGTLPFDSWFEVDVFLKIVDRGYRVLPQFPANRKRIDLVVEGLCGRLAVECDGDEVHMDRWEEDQMRQRDLERVGWTFWRVRGSDFYRDPDGALTELWAILTKHKITPRHAWESDRKKAERESTARDRDPSEEAQGLRREAVTDDDEGPEDNVEQARDLPSMDNGEDSLLRAAKAVTPRRWRPEETPPLSIQTAIVQSLQKCPNRSCTLKSLTSRVLRELHVSTRGNPRLEFEKRVMRNVGALKRKGFVEEYKAKNRRIRLLESAQETMLFE